MKKIYVKVVVAVLLFIIVQGVGSIVAVLAEQGVEALTSGNLTANLGTTTLALTVAGTGLVSALLLVWMGMIRPCKTFRPTGPKGLRLPGLILVSFVSGVTGMGLLSEQLDLPNLMQEEFLELSQNVWGVLCVGVVGPVMEELFFREGLEGGMLRAGVRPWTAILVSAACFGLIHVNPAQVPFAAAIGVLLGMVYYKCGRNILLCGLLHIINNCISVAEMRVLGEDIKDFSYVQTLGGPVPASVIMVACLVLCVWTARMFWREK